MRDPVDYAPPARKQIAFLTEMTPRSPFTHPEVEVAVDIDKIRAWRTTSRVALEALTTESRGAWARGLANLIAGEIRETIEAQVAQDLQKELDTKFPCVIY